MRITKQQIRQLRRDNAQWGDVLVNVSREQWPAAAIRNVANPPHEVLRSRDFLVQIFDHEGHTRITINRTDWDENKNQFRDDISWDEIQRLKAEAGYASRWAVECYPPTVDVVNVANMRHVWLLTEAPAFGWHRTSQASEAA